jgi:hypothetical protein
MRGICSNDVDMIKIGGRGASIGELEVFGN